MNTHVYPWTKHTRGPMICQSQTGETDISTNTTKVTNQATSHDHTGWTLLHNSDDPRPPGDIIPLRSTNSMLIELPYKECPSSMQLAISPIQ